MSGPTAPPKPSAFALPLAVTPVAPAPFIGKVQLRERGPGPEKLRAMRSVLASQAFADGLVHEIKAIADAAAPAEAVGTIRLQHAFQDAADRRAGDTELVKIIGVGGGSGLAIAAFVALFSITINPLFALLPALLGGTVTVACIGLFRRLDAERALYGRLEKAVEPLISRFRPGGPRCRTPSPTASGTALPWR